MISFGASVDPFRGWPLTALLDQSWVAILSLTQNFGVAMISFGVALDHSQCLISSGVARDQFWGVHYKFKSVT
jgi:hypothetical protein